MAIFALVSHHQSFMVHNSNGVDKKQQFIYSNLIKTCEVAASVTMMTNQWHKTEGITYEYLVNCTC